MCHSLQVWSNRFWKLLALPACLSVPSSLHQEVFPGFTRSPVASRLPQLTASLPFLSLTGTVFPNKKKKNKEKNNKNRKAERLPVLPPLIMSQSEPRHGVSELASSDPKCLNPSLGFWTHSAQSETLVYKWLKIDKASIGGLPSFTWKLTF